MPLISRGRCFRGDRYFGDLIGGQKVNVTFREGLLSELFGNNRHFCPLYILLQPFVDCERGIDILYHFCGESKECTALEMNLNPFSEGKRNVEPS